MISEHEMKELGQQNLGSEIKAYKLEQFIVLLPSFLIILTNIDDHYLIIPILIGIFLDFSSALIKQFWIITSAVTIPLSVAIYYGLGFILTYFKIELPATPAFSEYTVFYALITTRFLLSFFTSAGIASNYVELKEKEFKDQ